MKFSFRRLKVVGKKVRNNLSIFLLGLLLIVGILANLYIQKEKSSKTFDDVVAIYQTGDQNTAIKSLESIYLKDPKPEYAEKLAQYYYQEEDFQKFLDIISSAKLNSQVVVGLQGDYYNTIGDRDTAEKYYLQLIQISPKSSNFYIKLATFYQVKGDLASAIKTLRSGSEINPSSAKILVSLSSLYLKNGDEKQSRKCANQALALEPENSQAKILSQ